MAKKRKILCPVDFSAASDPAVALAGELAQGPQSQVILLHVFESSTQRGGKQTGATLAEAEVNKRISRLRERYLDEHQIKFTNVTRHGHPAEIIIDYAKSNQCDMIVMGTHGRTGLTRMMMGSVAQRVLQDPPCRVVVVRLPVKPEN